MADLGGLWEGEYRYAPAVGERPVPFDAYLSASGSSLTGRITEENTFVEDGPPLLVADLVGAVGGGEVVFVKRYAQADLDYDIHYEGVLDAHGERITGHWRIGVLRGAFEMTQLSGAPSFATEDATQSAAR